MKKSILVLEQIDSEFVTHDAFGKPIHRIPFDNKDAVNEIGLVIFGGGVDINSNIYNEKPSNYNQPSNHRRDRIEIGVFEWAKRNNIPMVGICRGAQLLTALNGGKLIQHVSGHGGKDHEVYIHTGESIEMNTCHHQMMFPWTSQKDFRILGACSPKRSTTYLGADNADVFKSWGLPDVFVRTTFVEPEVVWWPESRALCVQGHPEWMPVNSPMVQYVNECIDEFIVRGSTEGSSYIEQARS